MVQTRQFNPGEIIIRENDSGETAYYIESGKVAVFKDNHGQQVHIAYLSPGATFGEMSMVDDLPRSASVRAVEPTVVSEFGRDDLYVAMRDNPAIFGTFLKSIFNRLREANRVIASMQVHPGQAAATAALKDAGAKDAKFAIEGLTPRAVASIAQNPFPIKAFPFKIGRKSNDPFVYNHLEIEDTDPAQIARHHVSIVFDGMNVGVLDRGTEVGASVDGVRIGGRNGAGPIYFNGKEGLLILGSDDSPYRYKISVAW